MIIRVTDSSGKTIYLETNSDDLPTVVKDFHGKNELPRTSDLIAHDFGGAYISQVYPMRYEIEESLKNDHPVWAYSMLPHTNNRFSAYSDAFTIMNFQANENIKKMYRIVER